ncbi:hypothetical protein V490_00298 [Pseudogymnoascus sp. VKM F-3557]|nr:hypothetical protein V490_00298 [Pseudogymnoascus sp. VKM F-3557]
MYQVSLDLDEGRNLTPGSPEFVISLIDFCKELLEEANPSTSGCHANVCVEAFVPAAYSDIQPEILQLALDQITSLEQDAILLENAQRILKELKCFYEGGAKRDGRVDNVAKVFCRQPAATARTSRPSFWDLALCYMLIINLWMLFR